MFKLKLKNYRGFLNETFNFSRVNILIGENSAGKSSILKFFLALKQSFESPNNKESNLTLSGIYTDLGNYQEVIYNHQIERNLTFSFEFKKDYFDFFLNFIAPLSVRSFGEEIDMTTQLKKRREKIVESLNIKKFNSINISFELSNDLSEHNISTKISNKDLGKLEIIPSKLSISPEDDETVFIIGQILRCDIHFHSEQFQKSFVFQDIIINKEAFLSLVDGDSLNDAIKKKLGKDKEGIEKIYNQIAFLLVAQNYVLGQVSNIEYINPLISKPAERIYLEGDRKNSLRIADVKELTDFLSSNKADTSFKQELINILSEFGIASDIYIKKEGFTRELRVVLNELDNNIKDVGFGVSLQLPILAQALISENTAKLQGNSRDVRRGETLLIEQPEVHLHPRLQAKFIDMLLRMGNNNTYFIETHSEHIIRMLQILVKEKRYGLKAEDVSIHYLKRERNKISISHHKIDKITGKLNPNFPKGFYDVSYNLAFQLID